ncbi:glutamate-5-semialdehyde dehydrogenase [Neomicrococcus aestuarii]|uniref:Gamma-glutamyl phosphate reductase n=1 Tax=Neomicrococcus aestuarii TaxID=556325 RepID=A0A7W8TV17_9MICC|nr:glutamate-5-semialdehyde dehydrogenase [Neomicrococcus aestuarii]MBB5512056.1 glutamate-5-semialdehyde dehydrogenase [Neomicrococcus aestuarii]
MTETAHENSLENATAVEETPATAPENVSTELSPEQVNEKVSALADRARAASRILARADRDWKDLALREIGSQLNSRREAILAYNAIDVKRGQDNGTTEAMIDRLRLTDARIDGLVASLEELAGLPDPVGEVLRGQTLPNGLRLRQVCVPLGVIGVIYEARPNVTIDIAGLALKSGNAALLRGGTAAQETNKTLVGIIRDALRKVELPEDLILSTDEFGREGANAMMAARGKIDVLIPRGGRSLIQSVVQNSRVPVIETGEGNVHIFVDESADAEMATDILVNAKTQRPSVCNTVETLLLHENASTAGYEILRELNRRGVVLHVDDKAKAIAKEIPTVPATEEDYQTEYMNLDIAVHVVADMDEAITHIRKYTTGHTEAILTNDLKNANRFVEEVDSAAVMVNASTRFTDGGQMGLGAEVGISTQKMHARGPMGLRELTTTKWIVNGDGQVRV